MIAIDSIRTHVEALWGQALAIWASGGWAMVGLAVISFVMFAMGIHVHLMLRAKGFQSVPEARWRCWIGEPEQRRGPIGKLLDRVTTANCLKDIGKLFAHVRMGETAPFERDLRVMKVCVTAAPLLGLLGTVTGMLATFGALASGSGGEKTMGLVASGISEALITTETGLVVAIPGLFLQYQLVRRHGQYKAFLAHLQTVVAQTLYHRSLGCRRPIEEGADRACVGPADATSRDVGKSARI